MTHGQTKIMFSFVLSYFI